MTTKLMKFDLIIGNPPYNGGNDLNFLKKFVKFADKVTLVHPSTYLIDRKGNKRYNKIKELLDGQLKSVKLFNGNPVFGIGLFVPCAIIHYDKNYNGLVEVDNFGEKYTTDVWNITKYGKDWETIVKPFFNKMKEVCESDNIWTHKISDKQREEFNGKYYVQLAAIIGNHTNSDKQREEFNGKYYVQIANVRGHVEEKTISDDIFKDDFYTLIMKDSDKNKGIRNKIIRSDGYIVYEFNTEEEQNNFIEYLKTDFTRFCFSLYKNSRNLGYGELYLIPYLDFTETWDDEKLYKYFNIDEKTQKYIREFLPDYYGIRNITNYGKDWETIVKPFFEKMKNICESDNIWTHKISDKQRKEFDGKYYVQIANVLGDVAYRGDIRGVNMKLGFYHLQITDNFYTLILRESEINKGIRHKDARSDNYIVYEFDTEEEQNNFIEYLKTDFARFCLSLLKNSGVNGYNNMSLIPYLDFTEKWTDEKLYKYFNIDEKTQKYIRNFLPDYYKIYKDV